MSTTLQVVAADTIAIKETMTELESVNGLQVRMEEAEGRISQLEDVTEGLTTDKDAKEKKIKSLWERVQMLENHSKRNNVRLVGLKEKYGTNGTLETCVKKVLSEGLGIVMEGEFEIERVHRILAPMPSEDQPPRPVLIRAKFAQLGDETAPNRCTNIRCSTAGMLTSPLGHQRNRKKSTSDLDTLT
ncbi:unnamed protein product [Leuciscus chuanchicus]